MSLTPEQVAEFNRRAAAGEKAKKGWVSRIKMAALYVGLEFVCYSTATSGDKKFALRDEAVGETLTHDLDSLEAGKLAAESIIDVGYRAAMQEALAAKDARIAELEGQVAGLRAMGGLAGDAPDELFLKGDDSMGCDAWLWVERVKAGEPGGVLYRRVDVSAGGEG